MAYRRGVKWVKRHRVVVTGMGVVTSLGEGKVANAEGFRTGRQGFSPITEFDVRGLRTGVGGVIDLKQWAVPQRLSVYYEANGGRIDRASDMLLRAATEAWEQCGWDAVETSLVLGTSAGGMEWGEAFYRTKWTAPTRRLGLVRQTVGYQPQSQGQHVRRGLGLEAGELTMISNACASGANAVGHAGRMISWGRAERVLCGGYDAISQLVFSGFDALRALSPGGLPRPFDQNRDGLVLGEGAAVLALESFEGAERRGAEILGELVGYGAATDIHHLTQPHPDGDAALWSMVAACREARIEPSEVDYVNAHGTGTPRNDEAEGRAINRWAGECRGEMSVSSTKASTGHVLGGAGAVEAVVCLMAMRGGWLPPTLTVEVPDAVCEFDLVMAPREKLIRYALTNSFGFGGANATLIFRNLL